MPQPSLYPIRQCYKAPELDDSSGAFERGTIMVVIEKDLAWMRLSAFYTWTNKRDFPDKTFWVRCDQHPHQESEQDFINKVLACERQQDLVYRIIEEKVVIELELIH